MTANIPLPVGASTPRILTPSIYEPVSSSWEAFRADLVQNNDQRGLLKIVSWNIDFMAPGSARRASAAMDHLEDIFGHSSSLLVVMLQEVNSDSLAAIMTHHWVRSNFVLSDTEASEKYFTLMMVSRKIKTRAWLRVPLPSRMGRDALIVDISTPSTPEECAQVEQILRLCTTHLESMWEVEGDERRPLQLAEISALLKAPQTPLFKIKAGLVGGDMNSLSVLDAMSHKAENVQLEDVWEEKTSPPFPQPKRGRKDITFGRAKGNTWGYQSRNARARKRLDKFFYTGAVDLTPLPESQDVTGVIGRIGIGVKTKVDVQESGYEEIRLVRGKLVDKKEIVEHIDPGNNSSQRFIERLTYKDTDAWVSDHFSITIKIMLS